MHACSSSVICMRFNLIKQEMLWARASLLLYCRGLQGHERTAPSGSQQRGHSADDASGTSAPALSRPTAPGPHGDGATAATAFNMAALDGRSKVRIIQAGPGSVIGELDWVLRRTRAFQCVAASAARVRVLSRESHERLMRDAPHANGLLLQILLRSSLTTTVHAFQALERAVQ